MRIQITLKTISFYILFSFNTFNTIAQDSDFEVNQDNRYEKLLSEKRKVNSNLTYNDRYKIQIFNGTSESAKKTLNEFRLEFKNTDGTIIFNTPNYKVWVGNYRSRMEAERNLIEIKKKYKTVFLIKPSK